MEQVILDDRYSQTARDIGTAFDEDMHLLEIMQRRILNMKLTAGGGSI